MKTRRFPIIVWWLAAGWLTLARAVAAVPSADKDAPLPNEAVETNAEDTDDEAPAAEAASKPDPVAEKFWHAMKLFRSKRAEDLRAGRALLDEAAAAEFPHAQLLLGEAYLTGSFGYVKNPKKATAYLRLAAERGNAFAKVSYGLCLFTGVGVRKNVNAAYEFLSAALAPEADYSRPTPPAEFFATPAPEQGDNAGVANGVEVDPVDSAKARAHFVLAGICEFRKEPAVMQEHLVAAATAGPAGRAGIQRAAVLAAVNYAFGRGVPRDLDKANHMLDRSGKLVRQAGISLVHQFATAKLIDEFAVADLEEGLAKTGETLTGAMQLALAENLLNRKSKEYNPAEAVKWFALAGESGQPWAMVKLGLLYSGDKLGAPNPAKALEWFERAGSGEHPKHYLATANLVICYYNGIGTAADVSKAREIATRHRDHDLVCYLATIGRCPKTVIDYEQEAELNDIWAKKEKDPQAEWMLGRRYQNGWGVKGDLRTAVKWFAKAAAAGHAEAANDLGVLYEERGGWLGVSPAEAQAKSADLYRKAAEAGNAAATANLAYYYSAGRGVPKDMGKAEELYLKALAVDPHFGRALNNLGSLYEDRWRENEKAKQTEAAEKYRAMMLDYYERAAKEDFAHANFNLGRLYHDGAVGPVDFEKAYTHYEKAAEQGEAESRFRLGEMHEKGEGVPVTYTEAAYHYRLAALDGHLGALRRLVNFYLEGKGGTQDFDRAQFWLMRLVRFGQVSALATMADVAIQQEKYDVAVKLLNSLKDSRLPQLQGIAYQRLSLCYANGIGVKRRPKRAEAYRKKAIELGNGDAIYDEAQDMMSRGETKEALTLFEKAAQSSSQACFSLGQMNYFGQNMPKDVPKAMALFRRAAKEGHRDSLYFLAALCFNREAGAPAIDEAIDLASRAEAMGHPKAGELREKLELRRQHEAATAPTTLENHAS